MAATTAPKQCAYPGCDQSPAAPGSDRGAKPKYCDDPDHNPLSAHRERRRRQAEASGQRTEETGGQPVTLGITRVAELVGTLEKLTAQHADTLGRAITELRAVGDIESAEAEVYAARTSADQRVATAEARLAEEIQRRRDAEAERDAAQADREQADDATAQAVTRMDELERELAELRTATEQEVRTHPRQRGRRDPAGPPGRRPRHQRRPQRRRPPGRRRQHTRRASRAGSSPSPPGRGRCRHPSRARPGRRDRRDRPHPHRPPARTRTAHRRHQRPRHRPGRDPRRPTRPRRASRSRPGRRPHREPATRRTTQPSDRPRSRSSTGRGPGTSIPPSNPRQEGTG